MADFFISYTSVDEQWAEWVAFVLEEEGMSVIVQAWDFRPGCNFVLEMQRAAAEADRTIMVLSPDYLKSQFASPEWAAAFSKDPQGLRRGLVPVVIRNCQPDGLLAPLVHINLVGTAEADARQRLIDGVTINRAKPSARPTFPGASGRRPHKLFPGATQPSAIAAQPSIYIPKIRRTPSDIDKKRFLRQSFEEIRTYFQTALGQLMQHHENIENEFQMNTSSEFSVEIFVSGKSACACKAWVGGIHSDNGISYAEGRHIFGSNGCNEILALKDDDGDLFLSSIMGANFGQKASFDLNKMTPLQASEYLWRRFVSALER